MSSLEKKHLLEGLTLLDLSYRLPGPLAGSLLARLGARVIKIENKKAPDPFTYPLPGTNDSTFGEWYKEMSREKELVQLDFESEADLSTLHEYVNKVDGVLMGWPSSLQKELSLSQANLIQLNSPIAVLEIKASKNGPSHLHDLNVWAQTQLLSLHLRGREDDIVAPPFLPFAGVAYGQQLALQLLALINRSQKLARPQWMPCYFLESISEIFNPLWPTSHRQSGENSFLHNGAYPCYTIYRTKDGKYIAFAAIEEKFWNRVMKLFDLPLRPEDRFSRDAATFEILAKKFTSLTAAEIEHVLANESFCLSIL